MLGILQQDGLLSLMERGLLAYHLVSGERDGMQKHHGRPPAG